MRRERDSLGAKAVPSRALYGIFTQRARETFQLTGRPPHPALIRAYALVKKAAARANAALGVLPRRSRGPSRPPPIASPPAAFPTSPSSTASTPARARRSI